MLAGPFRGPNSNSKNQCTQQPLLYIFSFTMEWGQPGQHQNFGSKKKKDLTRTHAPCHREIYFHLDIGNITTLYKNWARSSQGLRRDPKVLPCRDVGFFFFFLSHGQIKATQRKVEQLTWQQLPVTHDRAVDAAADRRLGSCGANQRKHLGAAQCTTLQINKRKLSQSTTATVAE